MRCVPHLDGLPVMCKGKAGALAIHAITQRLPKPLLCPCKQSVPSRAQQLGSRTTPSFGAIPYSWHLMSLAVGTAESGSIPGSTWQTHAGADALNVGHVSNRNL